MNVCKRIVRQRSNAEYGQASIKILKKVRQEIKDKESIAERICPVNCFYVQRDIYNSSKDRLIE